MSDSPQDLVNLALTGLARRADEQPVILSKCFPSRRTTGYSHMADRQVVNVNGQPVLNLQQMYDLVNELHKSADFLAFELFCTGGNAIVTIGTDVAATTLAETLRTYKIPTAASAELEEGSRPPGEWTESASASAWSGDEWSAASAAGRPAGRGLDGASGGSTVVAASGPVRRGRSALARRDGGWA